MAYADYDFYSSTYKGKAIKQVDFDFYAERASDYLDNIAGNSITVDDIKVKKACCAVAEAYQLNSKGGRIVSESVSGYSKTMEAAAQSKSDEQRLLAAAKMYIKTVGWL